MTICNFVHKSKGTIWVNQSIATLQNGKSTIKFKEMDFYGSLEFGNGCDNLRGWFWEILD